MVGIYKITNLMNSRVYVGQSWGVEGRLRDHMGDCAKNQHHNRWLQEDYNTFGRDAFDLQVLVTVGGCTQPILDSLEKCFIQIYESFRKEKGYNRTLGGARGLFTEDMKKTLRGPRRGIKKSPETRLKMKQPKSEEHKASMRKPKPAGFGAGCAERMKVRVLSEEALESYKRAGIAKMGKKIKGHSDEARQAQSERMKGHVMSEETRQKIREANQRRSAEKKLAKEQAGA